MRRLQLSSSFLSIIYKGVICLNLVDSFHQITLTKQILNPAFLARTQVVCNPMGLFIKVERQARAIPEQSPGKLIQIVTEHLLVVL